MIYKTNDLYVSSYLRAKWYECQIEKNGINKFCFVFQEEARKEVDIYMNQLIKNNINASKMVNEIKSLKSYISNNI